MKVLIDQSGKIENTSKDTVIAFSDSKTYSIKIPAKVKRQAQKMFKTQGAPKLFIYRTFAAGVFFLIREFLNEITDVVIDIEYPGKEKLIRDIILEFIRKNNLLEPDISFARIGRKPKVHYAAYDVFSKKKKPDKILSFEELFSPIKNDRGSLLGT